MTCTAPPRFVWPKSDCTTSSSVFTSPALIDVVAVIGAPEPVSGIIVSVASCVDAPGLKMRMSVRQLASPLLSAATPGRTNLFESTALIGTPLTSSGSPVPLSTTDAYAVILPSPPVTFTSTRPSLRFVMPFTASI